MNEKIDSSMKEREKGTHSQEIELALTQLQEKILRVDENFNSLISDITGDPPEKYLEDEKRNKERGKESVQLPLLVVLREAPDQLRSMSQKLTEMKNKFNFSLRDIFYRPGRFL